MKVFLIGMPGSGKTTLGNQLSKAMDLDFIDLDHEIAGKEGKNIPAIFNEEGEAYFRKVEAKLLRKITGSRKKFILATGGGTPCFYDNMNFMYDSGITLFLDVPVQELINRINDMQGKERPLLKAENSQKLQEKLEDIFNTRKRFYYMAHLTIEPLNTELNVLIDKIKEISKN
ncbi:shikimate kinase [soil metagenome]